ncbi:hypothetical protein Trydic_g2133 [Trypoxylus dichotomus]
MQRCWPTKWDWMLDEYKVLKDTLASVAEKSIIITKCEITDHRTIQPIPISTFTAGIQTRPTEISTSSDPYLGRCGNLACNPTGSQSENDRSCTSYYA